MRLVIGLLIDTDVVNTCLMKGCILLGGQWLHLQTQLCKVRTNVLNDLQIVLPRTGAEVFTTDKKEMTKAQGLDRLNFTIDLSERELSPSYLVLHTKTTVDTAIGADIGEIKGNIELDGMPEALYRQSVCLACHLLEEGNSYRRYQGLKVLYRAVWRSESTLHIRSRLIIDIPMECVEVVSCQDIIGRLPSTHSLVSNKKEVKGEDATAS